MAYLKYYRTENERHSDMWKTGIDFQMCVEMSKALFRHFKVPFIPVELMDKRKKRFRRVRRVHSWYQPKNALRKLERHIVLHPSMLNPLTVAHEVAHYVHDVDQTKRRAEHRLRDAKTATYTPIPKERWHGPQHLRFTNQGIAFLKERYGQKLTPAPVLDTKVEKTQAADMIKAYFDQLPHCLDCPRCGTSQTKSNFGVRVMKRDAQGQPLVIRRQSYCKACR